jgi:hypothetical protein
MANKFKMETSIPNRKISPSDRSSGRPSHNYKRLGSPWEWLPQDISQTNRKKLN